MALCVPNTDQKSSILHISNTFLFVYVHDLGPGNKYTRSLEVLTREKATLQDADRQKWMRQAGYKSRLDLQ